MVCVYIYIYIYISTMCAHMHICTYNISIYIYIYIYVERDFVLRCTVCITETKQVECLSTKTYSYDLHTAAFKCASSNEALH